MEGPVTGTGDSLLIHYPVLSETAWFLSQGFYIQLFMVGTLHRFTIQYSRNLSGSFLRVSTFKYVGFTAFSNNPILLLTPNIKLNSDLMSGNDGVIKPDLEEKAPTSTAKMEKPCGSTIANPGPAYVFFFFFSILH